MPAGGIGLPLPELTQMPVPLQQGMSTGASTGRIPTCQSALVESPMDASHAAAAAAAAAATQAQSLANQAAEAQQRAQEAFNVRHHSVS